MITVIAKINKLIEKLFFIEFKYEEGSNGNSNNNNNDGNNNNNSNSNSQFNKDINTRSCENTVNYRTENQN